MGGGGGGGGVGWGWGGRGAGGGGESRDGNKLREQGHLFLNKRTNI